MERNDRRANYCCTNEGQLDKVGIRGCYWSSSYFMGMRDHVFYLYFSRSTVRLSTDYEAYGYRIDGFE